VNSLLQRYRKHTKLSENLPVVSAAEASGSTERNLAVLIARNQSMFFMFNVFNMYYFDW